MEIPKKYFTNDTVHQSMINDGKNGILSCGFLHKPHAGYTQRHLIFGYYGAFILLSGSGTFIDNSGNSTPIYAGCYVQRLPNIPHTTVVDPTGDWLEFFVCFNKETYETLKNLKLIQNSFVIYPGLSTLLFQKCTFLLDAFKKNSTDQIGTLYLDTLDFVLFIFSEANRLSSDISEHRIMNKACELLCQIPPHFINAKEVAAALDISYESFRKKFKQFYKTSPTAFQLNYRINYSKTLLIDTQKTINEIALICNFSDAFSYSKAFKLRCGESPEHFRRTRL